MVIIVYKVFQNKYPNTEVLMAAKRKLKTIFVQLLSTAKTGYSYTTKRNRLSEKIEKVKYDPIISKHVVFKEKR